MTSPFSSYIISSTFSASTGFPSSSISFTIPSSFSAGYSNFSRFFFGLIKVKNKKTIFNKTLLYKKGGGVLFSL